MADRSISDRAGICAISGAGGFVGTYLMPELIARGWTVVPLRRAQVDFRDKSAIATFLTDHSITDIVHLAAESNPASGDPRAFYESNAFLTESLLEAASSIHLPGRFLLASATSVYGDGGLDPIREDAPLRPLNHYGASKLLAEAITSWYGNRLDVTIARPSNCIGLGQKPTYLVPKLVSAFASRQPEIAMGDQDIARDMVDIRDAVDILCRTLAASPRSVDRINVASGRATPIRDILTTLERLTSHQPVIRRDERFVRQGDMRYQACSIERALQLGHAPRYQLEDTLSWMLSKPSI